MNEPFNAEGYFIIPMSNDTCVITGVRDKAVKTREIPAWLKDNRVTHGEYRVSAIGENAFSESAMLLRVTVPVGVKSIGARAFSYCSALRNVTLPEGLESIGMMAFYGCPRMQLLIIPASVTEIGVWAFDNCDSLTLRVARGSYAEQYARENNIPYQLY